MATISHRVSNGISFKQAEPFKYVTEANHNGFLEDRTIQIIDFRVFGGGEESRCREGFWQCKFHNGFSLHSFYFLLYHYFMHLLQYLRKYFYNSSTCALLLLSSQFRYSPPRDDTPYFSIRESMSEFFADSQILSPSFDELQILRLKF